jgi:hypothetical protein
MKYAAQTSVSVEKSRAEIERTLVRYGATKYAFFSEQTRPALKAALDKFRPLMPWTSEGRDE